MAGDDWTTGQFDEDGNAFDDFVIPEGVQDGKSVEAVEKEGQFKTPPLGVHELFVQKIDFKTVVDGEPQTTMIPVMLDGFKTSYETYQGSITFAMVADPECRVSQFFSTPPIDPQQLDAYQNGLGINADGSEKGKNSAGFGWRQLKQMLGHLGFAFPESGVIPPEARRIGSWKTWPDGTRRTVMAEIVPQEQNGKPHPKGYVNIKLFSFADSADTIAKRAKFGLPASSPKGKSNPAKPGNLPGQQSHPALGGGNGASPASVTTAAAGHAAKAVDPLANVEI